MTDADVKPLTPEETARITALRRGIVKVIRGSAPGDAMTAMMSMVAAVGFSHGVEEQELQREVAAYIKRGYGDMKAKRESSLQ